MTSRDLCQPLNEHDWDMQSERKESDRIFTFSQNKEINQATKALLTVAFVLLIIVSIGIIAVISIYKHNHHSHSDTNKYCTTTDCLQLASDLSKSINKSVDPCEDFYHYVCDGWNSQNAWIDIKTPQYTQFDEVSTKEKDLFLDALFYGTKASLVNYSSVQKASAYYKTCYDSTVDIEERGESEFMDNLIKQTTFASSDHWDSKQQSGFHDALTHLSQIKFNTFFTLEPQDVLVPGFMQFLSLWQQYDSVNASDIIQSTFVPLYMSYFDLNATAAKEMGFNVVSFADELFNISTVNNAEYISDDGIQSMMKRAPFSNLSNIFKATNLMNYTKLVNDVFGSSSNILQFQYLTGGVSYFQQLGPFIESESPLTVQFYIWTSILYYYLDFQDTFSQNRYEDRSDFCFERTVNAFPFVYGYILFNAMYSDETYQIASTLAESVKTDGLKVLIQESKWLDDASKSAALKKVQYMELYIGSPPLIKYGENIDDYYEEAEQSMNAEWIENVEKITDWKYKHMNDTFWGNANDLIGDWPSAFSYPQDYDSWLTDINAFYWLTENWFTIPVTISQPPFLSSDPLYPSALNFGALGVISGHEMSHAFDSDGSAYNYNGTFVGSIFGNQTQQKYKDKMKCFEEQYNEIIVDEAHGQNIYDNGTRTMDENVADNAGIWASWNAWTKHVQKNGNDKLLFGIDLNQDQLFFIGYARLWCSANRPGSYENWTDVHSENYARVIAPLQNIPHFADAFECKPGSRMNPKQKCQMW